MGHETAQQNNVFLVGMPGCGKSTVGRLLANSLGQKFVDSDEEIVRRNGVEIATIFEIEGEAGFREREAAVLNDVTQSSSIVLATGGGVILREDNRRILRSRGLVVYLRASLDVLAARTAKKFGSSGMPSKRPLLEGPNRRGTLEALLMVREPLYEATAHVVIDANTTQRAKFLQKLLALIDAARRALPEKT
jgi:shikimate kinase